MTTDVPAMVVPPPPEEDPPDMPVDPNQSVDTSGSPDPHRSGETPGPGDGPDDSLEVVDVDGNQPPMHTPRSSSDQHSEVMTMLRGINQRLSRLENRVVHHNEAIEELRTRISCPSPGLAESQLL
jgi:hypothetical protein